MNLKDQISDVCFKLCCRREWVKEREREKQELEEALRCNLKQLNISLSVGGRSEN